MVFYIIGLGLGDENDITLKGLQAIRSCSEVYLEAYTSVLPIPTAKMEELYGKKLVVADRELVESGIDPIIARAKDTNIAFLVVGDPFGATTHTDMEVRAREMGVKFEVVHNASIMNAVGACGLQLYRYGQTVTICFFTPTWRPDSFYDRVAENRKLGLHTLCLLDIKVKEQSEENMARGRKIYEPPRFMSINTAIAQMLEIEEKRQEGAYSAETMAVGCARIGTSDQKIIAGKLGDLLNVDFGAPLHSLVLCGHLHVIEEEMMKFLSIEAQAAAQAAEAPAASS